MNSKKILFLVTFTFIHLSIKTSEDFIDTLIREKKKYAKMNTKMPKIQTTKKHLSNTPKFETAPNTPHLSNEKKRNTLLNYVYFLTNAFLRQFSH
ncbi:hypothetical protein HYV11_01550 [Candidatus Dependentiae bacterium]|nr:hypothetical protein [Candidatus Dependentiae bacterium]